MFIVGIITSSDKCSKGLRIDQSGKLINEIMEKAGYIVESYSILPDEQSILSAEMIRMADELKVDLILTTGGTGFNERDIMPEATMAVIDRFVPGIPEAIRNYSLQITKRAMLSRAVSGIRKKTLIINLPGSPKAVNESLNYIIDVVKHGLEILTNKASECAQKDS